MKGVYWWGRGGGLELKLNQKVLTDDNQIWMVFSELMFLLNFSLTVFTDAYQCFQLVNNTVKDTVAEPYFLSILQHLLCIRDDLFSR